jgi:hypothetical protein
VCFEEGESDFFHTKRSEITAIFSRHLPASRGSYYRPNARYGACRVQMQCCQSLNQGRTIRARTPQHPGIVAPPLFCFPQSHAAMLPLGLFESFCGLWHQWRFGLSFPAGHLTPPILPSRSLCQASGRQRTSVPFNAFTGTVWDAFHELEFHPLGRKVFARKSAFREKRAEFPSRSYH